MKITTTETPTTTMVVAWITVAAAMMAEISAAVITEVVTLEVVTTDKDPKLITYVITHSRFALYDNSQISVCHSTNFLVSFTP